MIDALESGDGYFSDDRFGPNAKQFEVGLGKAALPRLRQGIRSVRIGPGKLLKAGPGGKE